MADQEKAPAAVYVSWGTFKNSLDALSQGIPNAIDRTAFPGLNWSVQAQLITGLKFLGLITETGVPTSDLAAVAVTDEQARKEALGRVLRQRYSSLITLDLMKTTPAQLADAMAQAYGVGGETRDKAMRFFLQAAKYVDLPLGHLLKQAKISASNGARRRRLAGRPQADDAAESDDHEETSAPVAAATDGESQTITLRSGGTLTVMASARFLKMSKEDRDFVFDLIDRITKYETSARPVPEGQKL